MNVGSLLPRHARFRGDRLAVVCGEDRLTWGELEARVNRLANALHAAGLRKGEKLALVVPNALEVLEIYLAGARMGYVLVPLSPLLRSSALSVLLRDSDTAAVIISHELVGELDAVRSELSGIRANGFIKIGGGPVPGYRDYHEMTALASPDAPPRVDIEDDHHFNIVYSSGTTGLPKGIIHTHYVRANYCTHFASTFRMTPESVVIHAGSLVFNGAFVTLMSWLFLGATYVLQKRFNPDEFIAAIEREGVTHMMMVPSQITAMMNAPNFEPDRLRSIEMLCTVGAPFHFEHKERLIAALPNVFYELYGLTEGVITILDKHDVSRKSKSVGCSQPFFEMRIVDENGNDQPPGEVGEIIGRGPILMAGYYKRPDLTAQAIRNGWMHSGDMGYLDEDGYLYLVDRKKDLIISGGVNVYPRDIEEVVVAHPLVEEVAVFGVPSDKWGEAPLAAVVLKAGATVEPSELKSWINARVGARYQQVCDVVIKGEFPRNAAGKTLKRVMRDEYWTDRTVQI
jgi:acyl-CoA synthetase (AMP-forming)/AMP-acid ligase II